MTWIEITFFVLLCGVFMFGFIVDVGLMGEGPPAIFLLPLMFFMIFGALPYMVVDSNTETTFIKEEPIKILSNVMADGKMVIITDTVDKVVFTEYKDIVNIQSGKGLVKRYYKKDVYYGPDSKWSNIEIK